MRFTFAVVGRDEAATLERVLDMAAAAARPGDAVWFVDSASRDVSREVASAWGAEVIAAPAGKGRAIAAALERCREGRLVLLDGDVRYAERNLARILREASEADPGAAMVVGQVAPGDKRTVISKFIYAPLVRALFPDAPQPRRPLSGFRALDATLDYGRVPPGYGVETHLNLHVAATGGATRFCDLGPHRGPLRGYRHIPGMAADIAEAILDAAETHGRLTATERPRWQEWIDRLLTEVAEPPPESAPDGDYLRRLREAAARPLPVSARAL